MDDGVKEFLEKNHAAAMVTLRSDGSAHTVRVGVALVDGKVWSSGVPGRVRTGHLRRDPRSTLFVFDTDPGASWRWLSLESTVTILDGPDAAEQNLRLFQVMQKDMQPGPSPGNLLWEGKEKTPEEFLQAMVDEQRLIYEFEITRTYGMY